MDTHDAHDQKPVRPNRRPELTDADKVARAHVIAREVGDLMFELEQLADPYGELPYVFPLGEDASDYIGSAHTITSFIGSMIPKEVV